MLNSVRVKVALLVVAFVASSVAFAYVGGRTIDNVKVNGPVYRDIVRGKDLISDVLPPPSYVIEAYLLVLELTAAPDPHTRAVLIERSVRLRVLFEERHAFWSKELPPGPLRRAMLVDAYTPAVEFFRIRDEQFLPALLAGHFDVANALARGPLAEHYEAHRRAIDTVTELATAESVTHEHTASEEVTYASRLLVGLGCAMAVVAVAIGLTLNHIGRTLRRKLEEQKELFERMSIQDGLTGIANRRLFDRMLAAGWRRALRDRRPISLLMIDVDYFKSYNDKYGHPKGDECLRTIAAALTGAVNRPDDLVARYGGEEFVVLLPGTDRAGALMIGELVCAAVEKLKLPHAESNLADRHVTISVGVATLFPSGSKVPENLVELADANLYEAKRAGRNRTFQSETEEQSLTGERVALASSG